MRFTLFVATDRQPDTDPFALDDIDAWVERADQFGQRRDHG